MRLITSGTRFTSRLFTVLKVLVFYLLQGDECGQHITSAARGDFTAQDVLLHRGSRLALQHHLLFLLSVYGQVADFLQNPG